MENQFPYKLYSEEKYTNIINAVLPKHYQIVVPSDSLAKEIYPSLKEPFVGACISTGDQTQVSLNYGDFEIPEGSLIVHLRLFREDHQISKAYETILFPIKSGAIISVPVKFYEDRYRPILTSCGLAGIAEANHLPSKKFGHVTEYTVNGAIIPVIIDFGKQEREKLNNQNFSGYYGHSS